MFGIGNGAINAQFRYMYLYEQYRRSYERMEKEDVIDSIMSMNPLEKLLAHIHETMLPSETRAKYIAARDVLKKK